MNIRHQTVETGSSVWKFLLLALALVVNATLLFRLVWGQQSLVSYRELIAQHESLTSEIERLDSENSALSREIRLLQSDGKYLEKMIRQRLNFVKNNEILYLFDGSGNTGAEPHDNAH